MTDEEKMPRLATSVRLSAGERDMAETIAREVRRRYGIRFSINDAVRAALRIAVARPRLLRPETKGPAETGPVSRNRSNL